MKNKILFALFTALMTAALVVGCNNFAGPDSLGGAKELGTLNLTVQGVGAARTIMPEGVELTFDATLTPATGDPIVRTLYAGKNVLKVAPGTYTITVKAYNGDAVFAQGSKSGVIVTATEGANETITLTEETSDVQGTFTWDLTQVEAVITTVAIDIYEVPDLDALDLDTLGAAVESSTTATDTAQLDPGTYVVAFDVDGIKWYEILWIYSGLTSSYTPDSFGDGVDFTGAGTTLLDVILTDLAASKYGITATEMGLVGVAGVVAGNQADVGAFAKIIIETAGNSAPVDLPKLKELVDATLVAMAAVGVDPDPDPAKRTAAEAEILAIANVPNGTSVIASNIDWSGWDASQDKYAITVTVGSYKVTVNVPPIKDSEFIEVLTLSQAYAVYRFNLPSGQTFGNYKAIKATYLMDATEFAKTTNSSRLMGNYSPSKFAVSSDSKNYMLFKFGSAADDTNANGPYIYQNNSGATGIPSGASANNWFTISYPLVGNTPHSQFLATSKPADSDTGPFYFGVGLPGNGGVGNAKTQKVKNITLVHKTDPTKNVVLHEYSFFGYVGYANDDSNSTFIRTFEDNLDYTGLASTFSLDLSQKFNGAKGGAFSSNALALTNDFADGSLVLTYGGTYREIFFIPLENPAQINMVKDAASLFFIINGTSTNNKNFRFALGNPLADANWQSTTLPSGDFNDAINGKLLSVTFESGRKDERLGYFVLQQTGSDADVLTITSIKIKCVN